MSVLTPYNFEVISNNPDDPPIVQNMQIPVDGVFIKAECDSEGRPALWYEVDQDAPLQNCYLSAVLNGHVVPYDGYYKPGMKWYYRAALPTDTYTWYIYLGFEPSN